MGRVFAWAERQGGIEAMEKNSAMKSSLLYNTIQESAGFYTCTVDKACWSRMNVPFRIKNGDETLEAAFLKGAEQKGMIQLKGHR